MKSQICDVLNIEFPLVAFSHCRDVVAAVSKAGGMGVLGAVGLSPEKLEIELNWIDEHVDGKPYGVDVLVPNSYVGKGENLTTDDLRSMIPQEHREFRADILEQHNIDASDLRGDAESQKIEKNSNQLLSYTNIIKENSFDIKKDIIEHLWKVIISDNTIDQYESNLMRRICGLIYFSDKDCAEIKLKLMNN